MEEKGKHYDFERVCPNKENAEYVLNSVIEEYKNSSNWEIGKQEIIEMPSGEYKVFVELVHRENSNTMRF